MGLAGGSAPGPPLPQTARFWALMLYAFALGVFGAGAALLFMGVIGEAAAGAGPAFRYALRRALVVGGCPRRLPRRLSCAG